MRQGAQDFNQLVERQESGYRDRLTEYRKELGKLNREIESIEGQLRPEVLKQLLELKALKEKQIEEHDKIKPAPPVQPTDELTDEQQAASAAVEALAKRLKELEDAGSASATAITDLAGKQKAIQSIRERVRLFDRQYDQLKKETADDLKLLSLSIDTIIAVEKKTAMLDELAENIAADQAMQAEGEEARAFERQSITGQIAAYTSMLNARQQKYQNEKQAMEQWETQRIALVGAAGNAESQEGINAGIARLNALPIALVEREARRRVLARDVFDVLAEQRNAREVLFAPVQDLIGKNSLIRDEYKLQFKASLTGHPDTLSGRLFELIKQQSGEFRGDEALSTVRRVAEQYDLNTPDGALQFVEELYRKVRDTAAASDKYGVASLLRKGHSSAEVYDLLYGLNFLEPRYTLLFQDALIAELSPGQRGALLLIFYLLVDKGHNPIILDQPEENLDNETVVSLLVPVLTEAKKRRQILMVTHNPNLAVVCDAEQVIYSSFDRKTQSRITYISGCRASRQLGQIA